MNRVDNTYKQLVKKVLTEGQYKENRTGVNTISKFGVSYSIDNSENFPLLTTKKMDGGRWESIVHELLWYLSGEEHIRNLQEHTSIWNQWADEDGELDTAYGRFWRRYPIPTPSAHLEGETWPKLSGDDSSKNVDWEEQGVYTFDQIQHVIDNLKENPNSRRHVVTAWHPANAAVSTLPPCHYTSVFNVQNGDTLNLHLTQRSGDMALGIPFNIASYALLQRIIAQEVGLEVGEFHHSITDAHIYCGESDRGEYWKDNLSNLSVAIGSDEMNSSIRKVKEEAPDDPDNHDHIPGLLEQFTRTAYDSPNVKIADKPIDKLEYDDFKLMNYESHESINYAVAK